MSQEGVVSFDLGNQSQLMPHEDFLDGLSVFFREAAHHEISVVGAIITLVVENQLRDHFIRATVVEHHHLREVEHGNAERAKPAELALDAEAQRLAGWTGDEMREQARDGARHQRRQIESNRGNSPEAVMHGVASPVSRFLDDQEE
jgi:hypothetical protein